MRQARTILPTYSADTFGVCSALYELDGMIVMHDASGCNSTYTTHDEPRWYDSYSRVFISGLTETDAILGNDDKLINDMLTAIHELHPSFAAVVGTPIPMMTGFDYTAVAAQIERESGIPCFGFPENGMRSYMCGVSDALAALAERMTDDNIEKRAGTVNILGATPLDFSLSGTVPSIKKLLADNGWNVTGCWAMGSNLDEIAKAGEAQVNLVISGSGMKAAKVLKNRFGTPYVAGMPTGTEFSNEVLKCLRETAADGNDRIAFADLVPDARERTLIIGDGVIARSLAAGYGLRQGRVARTIYPLEMLAEQNGVLSGADAAIDDEDGIRAVCRDAETVIADPLYKAVIPEGCRFIPLPHTAFSGRMFGKNMPDLTKFDVREERI